MATSTLVQYLETTANLAAGGTTTLGGDISDRRQVETFLTVGAITAGQWVMFDVAQTGAAKVVVVTPAAIVAAGNALTVGVALEAVTGTVASPQPVKVVVAGYVGSANVDAGVAAGNPLAAAEAAIGSAGVAGAGVTIPVCGVALTAVAAGKAEVWVYKQF